MPKRETGAGIWSPGRGLASRSGGEIVAQRQVEKAPDSAPNSVLPLGEKTRDSAPFVHRIQRHQSEPLPEAAPPSADRFKTAGRFLPPACANPEKAGHYVTVRRFLLGKKGTIGNTL